MGRQLTCTFLKFFQVHCWHNHKRMTQVLNCVCVCARASDYAVIKDAATAVWNEEKTTGEVHHGTCSWNAGGSVFATPTIAYQRRRRTTHLYLLFIFSLLTAVSSIAAMSSRRPLQPSSDVATGTDDSDILRGFFFSVGFLIYLQQALPNIYCTYHQVFTTHTTKYLLRVLPSIHCRHY